MTVTTANIFRTRPSTLCSLLGLALALSWANPTLSNPVAPTVASGNATFATQGNTLTVTNTPGAIINWQQFNIGANETTRFQQQSAQSTVLNRIGGQNASQIMGTLQSNGIVYLINPNGILFGQGSVIDVAGLVASSLNMSDANFLANRLVFDGGGLGGVSNLGSITTPSGGSVYLIGSSVSNAGIITSPQGQVLLAAGSSVSLAESSGPELSVTLAANGNEAKNLGTITASGGRIDIFGALIDQSGVLNADSATVDAAGTIRLQATDTTTVSGTISAVSQVGAGGTAMVLGNHVTLTDTAHIDVSGATGGGTALVGGDYQGKNAAVQNATATTIKAGAKIKADATDNGNGGKVIVWSNDKTIFDGFISARGGANGGNGGFVETSGKVLNFTGGVDTLAPKGATGMWLLDPDVICLINATSSGLGCSAAAFQGIGGQTWLSAGTERSIIFESGAGSFDSMLSMSNVTLQATTQIYVDTLFSYTSGVTGNRTIKFSAPSIVVEGDFNMSSLSRANFYFDASGTALAPNRIAGVGVGSGDLSFASTSVFTLSDGDSEFRASNKVTMAGSTFTLGSGDLEVFAPTVDFSAGAPTLNAGFFGLHANSLMGVIPSTPNAVTEVDVTTYSPMADLYLGSTCGSGLCLTPGQVSSFASLAAEDLLFASNQDLIVSSSVTLSSVKSVALFAGRDMILKGPLNVTATGTTVAGGDDEDIPPLLMFTRGKFTNDNASGGITVNSGSGKWILIAPNAESVSLGSLTAPLTSQVSGAPKPTWSSTGPTDDEVDGFDDFFANSAWRNFFAGVMSGGNGILYFAATTIDPCLYTPVACSSNGGTIPSVVRDTETVVFDVVQGEVQYDAALNIITDETTEGDGTQTASSGAAGTLTVGGRKVDKASMDAARKEVARQRQQARDVEARKSPAQLKQEAQQAKGEAKKASTEAKRVEAEAKKTETVARKTETEAKKADSEAKKAESEHKQAEATVGKKAEADARQHDNDAKQAEREVRDAKTPEARASAEARKAEAESKKADAESRQTEVAVKKAEAETKQATAEGKKAEAQAQQREAEVKKTEAGAKQAEAEHKQAEAEHKLALAEVKEARSPQQKASAERRAEEKRVESEVKKATSEVRKEAAETRKAQTESAKAEAESHKTRAEARKSEMESKRAEGESRQAESRARKAESESKKADADIAKARSEGKPGEVKKAEERKLTAERTKAGHEKQANEKKREAETKRGEAEKKDGEARGKQREADTKRAEAGKKSEERRERAVKAFAAAATTAASPEKLAQVMALRHEYKSETLQAALQILAANPRANALPACSGGSTLCIPSGSRNAQQIAQQVARLSPPKVPTQAFLPQIQRKIAVVLAVNEYSDKLIPPLESPAQDGEAIAAVMREKMGYEVKVIRNAGRDDIVKSLNAVAAEVGPDDSVAVYYAGHGYQTGDTGGESEGYWLPSDASVREPSRWISNSDVSKLLGNIPAKQVLLVSDSCYSGAFAKEAKVTAGSSEPAQILGKRSVVVMSSGGEEPVSDDGRDGHSVFAASLIENLGKVGTVGSGRGVFEAVRKQVVEESQQVPQYGAATSAGHQEGGDYLMEARRY